MGYFVACQMNLLHVYLPESTVNLPIEIQGRARAPCGKETYFFIVGVAVVVAVVVVVTERRNLACGEAPKRSNILVFFPSVPADPKSVIYLFLYRPRGTCCCVVWESVEVKSKDGMGMTAAYMAEACSKTVPFYIFRACMVQKFIST